MRFLLYIIVCLSLFTTGCGEKNSIAPENGKRKAEFVGGTKALKEYLIENVKYPLKARINNHQGKVVVQFRVERDGSITCVEVVESSGSEYLDFSAVHTIQNMPKWQPREIKGEKVVSVCRVPINFKR
ncbi:MAG: energy transducer TonB [Salegentibacter mishustinae]|nr:energy transducer TonB [Salegentibacter mishustinae]